MISFLHTDPLSRTKPVVDTCDERFTTSDGMQYLHGPIVGWVRQSSCTVSCSDEELIRRAYAGPQEFISARELLNPRRTGDNVDKIFLGSVLLEDRRQDDRRS